MVVSRKAKEEAESGAQMDLRLTHIRNKGVDNQKWYALNAGIFLFQLINNLSRYNQS